ncbi:MAG TPA: acetate/propionate family kinase [Alphaproteobacteria bacterium]|nr:acetate/propionate family kinase [Alphaproteobacteria bacterium]HNS44842.1 acetate/propionate family kinase [Alphaproteobacteria bacterium]
MPTSPSALLVINAGSSSVKYRVFDLSDLSVLTSDKIMRIGENGGEFATHEDAFVFLLERVKTFSIIAAAHRVVHGGEKYNSAAHITPKILNDLRELSPLAPLHQPHNLNAIKTLGKLLPDIPQYVDFDTAFHTGHDPIFDSYALPEDLRAQGLRRYGFHGLSYESICHQLKDSHLDAYRGRVVIAHLGNGASLCAVKNGKSIDTTMGLTALEGLPMGTRSGSIDPGLIIYLAKSLNYSPDKIEDILYNHSGLLGLSGISNDVKTLLESADPRAEFVLDFFAHKVAQHVAMMATSLGGMDALVFTGGIGENAAPVRDNILSRLSFLPSFKSLVIKTDEELAMARHVKGLMDGQ